MYYTVIANLPDLQLSSNLANFTQNCLPWQRTLRNKKLVRIENKFGKNREKRFSTSD